MVMGLPKMMLFFIHHDYLQYHQGGRDGYDMLHPDDHDGGYLENRA